MVPAHRPMGFRTPGAVVLAAAGLVAVAAHHGWAATNTPAKSTARDVTGIGVALSGDTLTVGGTSVRLRGIAAPLAGETCQTRYGVEYDCYRRATEILQALIGDGPVDCKETATDRKGQVIGFCAAHGADLGAAMVARGWAFAYRRLDGRYVRAEAFAESHRIGMWAGKIETPWQWRSRKLNDTEH